MLDSIQREKLTARNLGQVDTPVSAALTLLEVTEMTWNAKPPIVWWIPSPWCLCKLWPLPSSALEFQF